MDAPGPLTAAKTGLALKGIRHAGSQAARSRVGKKVFEDRHDTLPHIALSTTALKSAYRNTAFPSADLDAVLPHWPRQPAAVPVGAPPGHHWSLALCAGRYERGPARLTIASKRPLIGEHRAGPAMDASHAAGG